MLDAQRRWTLVKEEMNGWGTLVPGTLSNSANLIPFEGGLLGFWHTLVDRQHYVQGALFLDASLTLKYRTDVLMDGSEVREGHKPGVLYVSSLIERDGQVLAFYGEADAHTGVALIDGHDLWTELQRSPFRPIEAIRIRYAGDSLSDAFLAMRVLHQFSTERQYPRIRLFVRTNAFAQPSNASAPRTSTCTGRRNRPTTARSMMEAVDSDGSLRRDCADVDRARVTAEFAG